MKTTGNNWQNILQKVKTILPENDGFECYAFRIGKYNEAVSHHFKFDYDPQTMAILVLNTPKMFESGFKTWLQSQRFPGESVHDISERIFNPIQDFMTSIFNNVVQNFPDDFLEVIHDFDLTPMRRPKILMCTCGHIAGAAFYCRPQLVSVEKSEIEALFPEKLEKPAIGVSLHPKFSGHFAFRAVLIFKDVKLPENFVEKTLENPMADKTEMEKLLVLFNLYWRDGRFRDCGSPIEKYSDLQLLYFSKPPIQRWEVIKHWFEDEKKLIERNLP